MYGYITLDLWTLSTLGVGMFLLYLDHYFSQGFNYDVLLGAVDMQGVQKLKCTNCGTMFMSETDTTMCPSCSGQSHEHHEHESNSMMGGCGCGHGH